MMYGKRISRRRFLAGSATAAAGIIAVRCGGGTSNKPATSGTSSGTPKRGGVIRMASTAPAASLDPCTDTTMFGELKTNAYGYLVHPTDWGDKLHGDVAQSWENPSELDWIFKVRPNVHFHNVDPVNGRLLTAEDVSYSYSYINTAPGAGLTGWNEWIDGWEAVDPQTVTIHTKKPYAYLFYTLGSPAMPIIPKEGIEKYGDLSQLVIGSGPFTLKSWDRNLGIELARNDNYHNPEIPYVDGLKVTTMADEAAIQAAFRSNAIDTYGAADRLKADAVKGTPGTSVMKYLNRLYAVFIFNANRVPAFKDERVREAVDLAIDRQALIDKLFLGDGELSGPVGPSWDTALPADEIKAAYVRDVTKAKQLLSSAGQENLSFKLSCSAYQDNADRAALIQQQLKEAGIDAQIEVKEVVTWLNDLFAVNYEANTYANLPYLSDDIQLQNHYSTSFNRAMDYGIKDDDIDALLLEVQSTVDNDKRKELAWEVQRKIIARHGPVLTLYEPYGYWVAYDYIKGYDPSPFGFGLYKFDMWLDKA